MQFTRLQDVVVHVPYMAYQMLLMTGLNFDHLDHTSHDIELNSVTRMINIEDTYRSFWGGGDLQ